MLNVSNGPLRPRVLIVDDALAKPETALGSAAQNLVSALETRNVDVTKALSIADGTAIVGYDASLASVLLNWNLGQNNGASHADASGFCHGFVSATPRRRSFCSPTARIRGAA